MQLDKYLIGILVVGLVIVSGISIITDAENNYDEFNLSSSERDTYNGVYSKADTILNESYSLSGNVKDKTLGGEVEETDSWESMIIGSYGAIRLVTGSLSLIFNLITTISVEIGIPTYFITALVTVITLSVIFSVIYLVFRFKS